MKATLVTPYNLAWPVWFGRLKARIEPFLLDVPHTVEHVGSTAIAGMTAKPVIDIDLVIERADFPRTCDALGRLGYIHEGDKGIPNREAFDLSEASLKGSLPAHHLYVCMKGTPELHKHIIFRDFMRRHPEWIKRLSAHKVELCERYANDRQAYIDGKSEMVRQITEAAKKEFRTSA
jgi:GrpB-like predicted nucleotidyltransferase (UPF0157 family)